MRASAPQRQRMPLRARVHGQTAACWRTWSAAPRSACGPTRCSSRRLCAARRKARALAGARQLRLRLSADARHRTQPTCAGAQALRAAHAPPRSATSLAAAPRLPLQQRATTTCSARGSRAAEERWARGRTRPALTRCRRKLGSRVVLSCLPACLPQLAALLCPRRRGAHARRRAARARRAIPTRSGGAPKRRASTPTRGGKVSDAGSHATHARLSKLFRLQKGG